MLKEFVEKIEGLSEAALLPQVINLDQGNNSIAYWWNPAEQMMAVTELKRPARHHSVTTLASLAGAYARYRTDAPSVWVSLTGIVVQADDGQDDFRRDQIGLKVVPSPLFTTLEKIPSDQEQLINCLRHDFKLSNITPESFELAIANLRWETSDIAENQLGTVRSTMGRSITAEVKSQGDIPPEISVTFSPFPALVEEIDFAVTVDCSVTINAKGRTISVRPYPGSLDIAKAKSVEALRRKVTELLEADETKVFAGTP